MCRDTIQSEHLTAGLLEDVAVAAVAFPSYDCVHAAKGTLSLFPAEVKTQRGFAASDQV